VGEEAGGMTFEQFAESHGLLIPYLIEGKWIRVKTADHPKKKNGAYKFLGDVGFVQNHATMTEVAMWKSGSSAGAIDRAGLRARMMIAAAEEKARHADARAKAEGMLKSAALDVHPYLAAKGFPKEKGLVLDGELLIPMREFRFYKQVNSLQRITAAGEKKFLFGGKAQGSVFFIGPAVPHERWLVEGYATGLSVRAALHELHRDAQIVVCFSDSNLAHVGKLVKELQPRAYVFGDNDKSGAGQRAAEATGLPWVMAADEGEDANDVQQRQGIRALAKIIRSVGAVRRGEVAA
jgi:putative DNA primase/helicase